MAIVVWIGLAEGLYVRALRILARRGVQVPRLQVLSWHGGIALWVVGLLSPIDTFGDDLLSFHMAQHLMIADLAAPLLLAGMRNPVLAFLLPRSVLVMFARRRRLRGLFRTARRPLVAVPVYALVLYTWHFSFAFQAAVRHPLVHAAQHASFVATGMLVWWSALEPKRRRLRGELWKIGHILSARMLGMFLGVGFVIARQPIYTGVYPAGQRRFGLSAVADQQIAGGLMMFLDILIMVFALGFFFLRAGQEHDRAGAAAAARPRAPARPV